MSNSGNIDAYFQRACQEGVHLQIFDSVWMLKPCKASEEQEVECDEPLK